MLCGFDRRGRDSASGTRSPGLDVALREISQFWSKIRFPIEIITKNYVKLSNYLCSIVMRFPRLVVVNIEIRTCKFSLRPMCE